VRKLLALMLCIQVCLAGCALRSGGRSSANQRGERLALERGKLSETTDPALRTKSYIAIADLRGVAARQVPMRAAADSL
jgi:hypothetical protein